MFSLGHGIAESALLDKKSGTIKIQMARRSERNCRKCRSIRRKWCTGRAAARANWHWNGKSGTEQTHLENLNCKKIWEKKECLELRDGIYRCVAALPVLVFDLMQLRSSPCPSSFKVSDRDRLSVRTSRLPNSMISLDSFFLMIGIRFSWVCEWITLSNDFY